MGSDGGSQKGSTLAPFLVKTYDMVDDSSTDHIVSWSSTGMSFVVWNSTDFCRDLLPQYFKHNNLSSFVRQLNTYGFRKICPDKWEFATEGFLKGQRDALKSIRRRKPLPPPNASGHAHDDGEHQAESPKCMISAHQELEGEVKRLQQEKMLLLDQLMKLQQEQLNMESSLVDLGKRLQSLEDRQQQILSFLAHVTNPAFWAQYVQNLPESNMLLLFNKKRRLLADEEGSAGATEHPEALVGTGDSGDNNENIAGTTTAEKAVLGTWWTNPMTTPTSDVQGILRQHSPCLPQNHSLGSSPISLGSGIFLREVHTPAECVDNEEAIVGTGEHRHDEGNIVGKTTGDKLALGILRTISKSVCSSADVPGEGIFRQLSLCPPSNQSSGTSPMSLSSGVTLREANTPDTPMNNVSDSGTCARQSSERMDNSIWTQNSGDDRMALSLHLRDRLRCVSSLATKSSEKKISKKGADGLGSNDGFWEKYLTESPSSTDSEPDSDSESIENEANPLERKFL